MTEQNTDAADQVEEQDAEVEQTDERSPNAEAAKYRTRLREVEAERDQLADRLQTMERTEVERAAATVMQDGSDFWLSATLDDCRDESGALNADRVREVAAGIVAERPHWGIAAPSAGQVGIGVPGQSSGSAAQWSDVIRPASR